MTLDGVKLFSSIKNLQNAAITVKAFGRISSHVMAENWQHLKDTFPSRRILCVRNETQSC